MKPFIAGIILSIAILATTFFGDLYSIGIWFIALIIALAAKKYSVAKGMGMGLLISFFILFIVCGGMVLGLY